MMPSNACLAFNRDIGAMHIVLCESLFCPDSLHAECAGYSPRHSSGSGFVGASPIPLWYDHSRSFCSLVRSAVATSLLLASLVYLLCDSCAVTHS